MIGGGFQAFRPSIPPMGVKVGGGFFGSIGSDIKNAAKNVFDNTEVSQGIRDMFGAHPAVPPVAGASAQLGAMPGAMGATAPAAGAAGGGFLHGVGEVFGGLLHGVESGALFSGIVSTVVNGFKVVTGQEQLSQAAGGVAADTTDGAVSGLTGAAVSGIALAAAGALGLAGLPLTILGIVGGLGGAMLGTALFQGTGLYSGIKNAVTNMFGGTTSTSQSTPVQQPAPAY